MFDSLLTQCSPVKQRGWSWKIRPRYRPSYASSFTRSRCGSYMLCRTMLCKLGILSEKRIKWQFPRVCNKDNLLSSRPLTYCSTGISKTKKRLMSCRAKLASRDNTEPATENAQARYPPPSNWDWWLLKQLITMFILAKSISSAPVYGIEIFRRFCLLCIRNKLLYSLTGLFPVSTVVFVHIHM